MQKQLKIGDEVEFHLTTNRSLQGDPIKGCVTHIFKNNERNPKFFQTIHLGNKEEGGKGKIKHFPVDIVQVEVGSIKFTINTESIVSVIHNETNKNAEPLLAYAASKSSKVFHPIDSPIVKNISECNLLVFKTKEEAEATGKTLSTKYNL